MAKINPHLDFTCPALHLADPGQVFQGRVVETNKYIKIAPDFGLSSRRANGSILSICDFWRNAEDGLKDKSAGADLFISEAINNWRKGNE